MSRFEVIDYLDRYARSFAAPVHAPVAVTAVEPDEAGQFRVRTSAGTWQARNVVIATGHSDRPSVPRLAAGLPTGIAQLVPTRYRNPGQLAPGGVLVVGASATGLQLASEIARTGRPVTLAVGRHTRMPRRYRGRDIMAWLDAMGVLSATPDQVADYAASRRQPSLQLVGSDDHHSLDLGVLERQGVRLVGHLVGAVDGRVYLEDDLAASIERAERKMHEQLDRIDRFVAQAGLEATCPAEDRPPLVPVPATPPMIDLAAERIDTVLWATGYRREYPWLHEPVLDSRGELVHDGGVTAVPGLYALGLYFMRHRNSSLLDGVGTDAVELADHIVRRLARRQVAAA